MLDEIDGLCAGLTTLQSRVFLRRDQYGGALSALGYDLWLTLCGAIDQFAEFVFGVLKLPNAFIHRLINLAVLSRFIGPYAAPGKRPAESGSNLPFLPNFGLWVGARVVLAARRRASMFRTA
jgi:hypothetical protein